MRELARLSVLVDDVPKIAAAAICGHLHLHNARTLRADDSEAHQSNQNLLLSREAEVNTKPELIIEADEVVASHGATVGQLDETAVFYLRSRGIEEARARRMLTGAFCRSVVEAIGPVAAREAFGARLEAALEAAS